jgi:hypothetical protein
MTRFSAVSILLLAGLGHSAEQTHPRLSDSGAIAEDRSALNVSTLEGSPTPRTEA